MEAIGTAQERVCWTERWQWLQGGATKFWESLTKTCDKLATGLEVAHERKEQSEG